MRGALKRRPTGLVLVLLTASTLTAVVAAPASAGRAYCDRVWGSLATSAGLSRETDLAHAGLDQTLQ